MKTLNIVQGSPEWHAHRATARNASEAPIMLGFSKKVTRGELIRMRAIGTEKEISEWVQKNLFDKGHEAEAAARPNAEGILCDTLYPVTATSDDGYLSASFDGITACDSVFWENKLFNQELAAYIEANNDLPDTHWPQVEQQFIVSGAERCLFTLADQDGNIKVQLEYQSDYDRRQMVLDGWKQFDEDVANYEHVEVSPKLEGRAPEQLPALRIEVTGMVTASNIEAFRDHALAVFAGINRDLQTDEDFANAEKTVKWCKEVEDKLEAGKQHALSQTADIDALFRAIDEISEEARRVRLDLDKLVKKRKEDVRVEILQENQLALNAHIQTINARLSPVQLPAIPVDFAGAMKGKKTVQTLRDAADAELARAKIAASQLSEAIGANLRIFDELAAEHKFLFRDLQQLALKPGDDFTLAVKARIADHKAAEAAKLEAERERIRQEEEAKARREAEAKVRAEQEVAAKAERAEEQRRQQAQMTNADQAKEVASEQSNPNPIAEIDDAITNAPIARQMPKKRERPTDAEIIMALCLAFNEPQSTVIVWLADMNMENVA